MLAEQIRIISKRLTDSVYTSWSSGYLDDFRDWAFKMRGAINNTAPILDNIAGEIARLENRIAELEASNAEKDKTILALATKLS